MTSIKTLSKIAGLLYLIVIGTGLFAEVFVRQALRVSNDAMATAQKIKASEMLYRLGFVADLSNFVIGIPCVLIIYIIFRSVNKQVAQLALIFVIIQTAVIAVNLLNQISALLFLGNDLYLSSFSPEQLASLSLHSLNLQAQGYGIGLVFFGFYCLLIGFLIYKSRFVSRFIGILYFITGLAYLFNSFSLFLFPNLSGTLFPYFALPAFIGEITFCLWLIIKGVDEKKGYNDLRPAPFI